MECTCIPPAEMPHTTALYSTFLNHFPRVSKFYAHPPNLNGILDAAGDIRADPSVRGAVVDVLSAQNKSFGGDAHTFRNLDRLREGALAVVTGQQVGLFGGPAYSIYKALTAIHVARGIDGEGNERCSHFLACDRRPRPRRSGSLFFCKARRPGTLRSDSGWNHGTPRGRNCVGRRRPRNCNASRRHARGPLRRRCGAMARRELWPRGDFWIFFRKIHDAHLRREGTDLSGSSVPGAASFGNADDVPRDKRP